jgi:hypothetical protein
MRCNRRAQACHFCGAVVPAKSGRMWRFRGRYYVAHIDCHSTGRPRVIATTFSSGDTVYQNINGRCEDAPCCGCCS